MDPYIVLLTGLGVVILGIAWLPMLLRNAPLSLPIFCVLLGIGLFIVPGTGPDPLTWEAMFASLAFVFLVRPVAGLIALTGSGLPMSERFVIGLFGIRGIGSLYYLAYAVNHSTLAEKEILWAVTGFVVMCSILIHGMTVTPVMNRLDAWWRRNDPKRFRAGANPPGVSVRSPLYYQGAESRDEARAGELWSGRVTLAE